MSDNRFIKGQTALQHLSQIHDELTNNFLKNQSAKASQALAMEIQQQFNKCLKLMKDAEKEATTEDNIFAQSINSIMHQKAEQELGKDYATLFGRTHERAQGYNIGQRLLDAHYDDIIEFAFVAMVNAITEYSQRIEIGVDAAKNTGKETASIINSEQLVSDMTKKFKSVAKQEAEKTSMLKSFTSFAQKIDAQVGEISFRGDVELNDFEKLAQLLSGHTYTIKNYRDTTIQRYGITTGQATQEFKPITGTLAALGYSAQERSHVWNHMKYSHSKNSAEFIAHKRHLQMTYELMGTGLVSSNGTYIPVADFLFLQRNFGGKNGWTSNIEVYSTAALIQEYIDNHSTTNASHVHESLLRAVMSSARTS